MVAISALAWVQVVGEQAVWLRILDIALGLASFVLVFFRRRWPVPVALVVLTLSLLSGWASGPAVLAAVSVATRRRWREIALTGSFGFAAAQFFLVTQPGQHPRPVLAQPLGQRAGQRCDGELRPLHRLPA